MKILALDTCSKACSVTICDSDELLAYGLLNTKLNHSKTLLPLIEHLLKQTELTLGDIELFALSKGPGSFTGVRIGMSVIKGFAFEKNIPCVPVSTLEGLAYFAADFNGVIAPVLDARKNQFYTAAFLAEDQKFTRLSEDDVIDCESMNSFLTQFNKPVFLVGDGAKLCYTNLSEKNNVFLLSDLYQVNSSFGVAKAAIKHFHEGNWVDAADMTPEYLRLSQAQVQLLEKQKKEKQQ